MNTRSMHRLSPLRIAGLLVLAISGVLAVASPASAYVTQAVGAPGSARPLTPIFCSAVGGLNYALPNSGYTAEVETMMLGVTPSPVYGLPQTVDEATRLDYSTDNGQTWHVWQWLYQSRSLTSRSQVALQSQSANLPKGFSYRVAAQVLQFKIGTSTLGSFGVGFDRRDDYSFTYASATFTNSIQITPTWYAIGCTVS